MTRLAFLLLLSTVGCATAQHEVEDMVIPRQLTRNDKHTVSAPVHATTDVQHGGVVTHGDEESTATRQDSVERPAIVPKKFGL